MAFTHSKKRTPARRKSDFLNLKDKILIVCEGEKTEPQYFENFKATNVEITIEGEGKNTQSLVKAAHYYFKKAKEKKKPYKKVWVVFDRDSFKKDNVDNAIYEAKKAGYEIAFSNEAFELWYLLHFSYRDTGMSRTEYKKTLTTLIKYEYKKNDPNIFDILFPHIQTAIKNAQRLAENYSDVHPYHSRNPYTSVHELVLELLSYNTKK